MRHTVAGTLHFAAGLLIAAFLLAPRAAAANQLPVFTSAPAPVADVGRDYRYDVRATDADGQTPTYELVQAPPGVALDATTGALRWAPKAAHLGNQSLSIRALDGAGGSALQSVTLRVREDFCSIYPIALPLDAIAPLAPGTRVTRLPRGVGAGNFSWLSWTGATDTPTLAQSLMPPGNSDFYVDPDDATDRQLDIGDYVQGAPGAMNASAVRAQLEALLTLDIILPVWELKREAGGRLDYRIAKFASVRLLDFDLTGHGWLSFDYRGEAVCYNKAPVANPQTLQTDEDTPLPITLRGTDANGDALTFRVTTQPEHGTLSGSGAQRVYSPAADFHGSDRFVIVANDGQLDSAPATIDLTVRPVNDAPQILTESLPGSAAVGLPYSAVIAARDPDGDTVLRFELVAPPTGAVIDAVTGELRWTPANGQGGTVALTVRVTDGGGLSAAREFTLVVAANGAPTFTTTPVTTVTAGQAYAYDADAVDPDGDTVRYALLSAPSGMQLDSTSGALQWSPIASDVGDHAMRLQANDNRGGNAVQEFTLHVASGNRAPVITSTAPLSGTTGSEYRYDVDATDADGDTLRFTLDRAPTGMTIDAASGLIAWTPSDAQIGEAIVTVQVTDGRAGKAAQTFTLTIARSNRAPVITSTAPLAATTGSAYRYDVDATDADGDTLAYALAGAPTGMSINAASGVITWTPSDTQIGTASVTVKVSDGRDGEAQQTFTLTITQRNRAPVITSSAPLAATTGSAYRYDVDATDADGDALAYALAGAPTGMTIHATSGLITWTPSGAQVGNAAVTVQVSDDRGGEATQTFTLTVAQANRAPVITSTAPTSAAAGTLYRYDVDASDADGDTLSYRLAGAPAGMTIESGSGEINWTPTEAQIGTVELTVEVRDGRDGSDEQAITLTVRRDNRAPSITSIPPANVAEGATYQYQVRAQDADQDALSYGLTRSPAGATLSATGALSWTANDARYRGGVRALNLMCREPARATSYDPEVRWHWRASTTHPTYANVMTTPLVMQATDDTGDGRVDTNDHPDVLIISYEGNITVASGIVRILDGRNGHEVAASDPALPLEPFSQLAAADIDGDGRIEIVAILKGGGLVVFEHDLSVKWTSRDATLNLGASYGGPSIADLEGDGVPEILLGNAVVKADGQLKWKGSLSFRGFNYGHGGGLSYAVDLTSSPGLEVIAGPSVYSADGRLLWQYGDSGDGFTAVADMDGDSQPELVSMAINGRFRVLRHDGSNIGGGRVGAGGGPPVIGNFDHDPQLEMGLTDLVGTYAFEHDGTRRWLSSLDQTNSYFEGLSLFDFEGDGRAEVVSASEKALRVLDGASGQILWSLPNTNDSLLEYPVVADVDRDGSADIVLVSNHGSDASKRGVRLISSVSRTWLPTRSLWNQHAYHVDNINDDGSVPRQPRKSWLGHNSFRQSGFGDRHALGLADLALFDLRLDPATASIHVTVTNRGLAPTAAATSVRLYAGDPQDGGDAIGTLAVPVLASGESRALTLAGVALETIDADLYARVDETNQLRECLDDNNGAAAAYFAISASDPGGLSARQAFTVNVDEVNAAPIIVSETLPTAAATEATEPYRHTVQVRDPDVGDGVRFDLFDAPTGLTLDPISGELRWSPVLDQIGSYTIRVRVTDLAGLSAERTFTLLVAGNRQPRITSQALESASETVAYRYPVTAQDNDGDPLLFELTSAPEGMTIVPATGVIEWLPRSGQHGEYIVTVRVTDGRGGEGIQSFRLFVSVEGNRPPTITSSPELTAPLQVVYEYAIVAADPDGDALRYRVRSGPTGMAVNQAGQVTWLPDAPLGSVHPVEIEVSDGRGGFVRQAFQLTVVASVRHAPVIVSTPTTVTPESQSFEYTVRATDRNLGEVPTYSFSHWPSFGTINSATGLMQVTPPDHFEGQSRSDDAACRVADRSVAEFEDLRNWTPVLTAGGHGGGPARWVVDPNDPTRVTLYENQAPSMLVSPIWADEGAFEFSMRTDGGDDDFMGFVWGFRDSQHYYVLRWGQGCGCVEVVSVDTPFPTYESQGGGVTVLHRIERMGWQANVDYTALIEITRGGAHIVLRQQGKIIASFFINDSRFDGGFVGLYNWSQDTTYYRARRMPVTPAPDLTVSAMQWDGVNVTARIRNRGSVASPPVPARLHRANQQGAYPQGLLLEAVLPALAPGEETQISYPWLAFSSNYLAFLVEVDPTDVLSECHESNNTRATPMFVVRATDPTLLYDDQAFGLQVDDVNEAPVFESNAPPGVVVGGTYSYQPRAADADIADRVRYELLSGPGGMHMLPSGLVIWTPKASDLGRTFEARIRALDLAGATDEQTVRFDVTRDPVITSTPVTFVLKPDATKPVLYRYDVEAADPDGDVLTYRLLTAPDGMTIDAATGVISWQSAFNWATQHFPVEVEVTDARGGRAAQEFTVIFSPYPLPNNRAPVFTSTPPLDAERLQPYQYQPTVDDDGTVLRYRLVKNPSGMLINASTGRIDWRPALVQWGDHEVVIEVRDAYNLTAVQSYRIEVEPDTGNRSPQITSSPTLVTDVGNDYRYPLVAVDPDGDALRVTIEFAPDGMIMDGERVLHWTPTEAQRGDQLVHLQVEDGRGGVARQEFLVRVGEATANTAPRIVSAAPAEARAGTEYRYPVVAEDTDGDALAYALTTAPAGMTIDAQGVIRHTPTAAQIGTHPVQVRVTDARGASTTQSYTLTVSAAAENRPPTITSLPTHFAKVGKTYRYAATATDPDGDTLTWSLVNPPAGAQVNAQTGVLSFVPTQAGALELVLRATDGDYYADQSWTLTVLDASFALAGALDLTPDPVAPGGSLKALLVVSGAAGPVTVDAKLQGAPVSLYLNQETTLTAPTTPGEYRIDVTLTDGYDTVVLSRPFHVIDPNDTSKPSATIHEPLETADEEILVVTAPRPIKISVADDALLSWTLRLFERGAPGSEAITLASGTTPVSHAHVAKLDPTLLHNGQYALILEAKDQSGNVIQDVVALSIEGAMKLGHFSLSFEDLSLPVAGLPVSVTRTYDTRQRHRAMDFGYGWSLAYRSVKVQESRRPGFGWQLRSYPTGPFGLIPKWCIESARGNVVSVTRPDGKVEKFRAVASPACNEVFALFEVDLHFEPMDGTHGTLVALNDLDGRFINNALADAGSPDAPLDPSNYRYVDAEGLEYTIDQGFGLRQLHERPGDNTITFGQNGIVHSNGTSVSFVRDAAGRVSKIVAPDQSERSYEYDATGNLAAVVDFGGGRTEFTYLTGHYLQDIIDARGVRVARNEYDDDGRLVAVIDADGKRVEYTRNIEGRVEQVKDRRGHTTTYVYNDRGDVLAETNALNQTTQRSYDADGNELTQTDPLNRTQRSTYDVLGNVLTQTNAAGETTANVYGKFNQLTRTTDHAGRVQLESTYRNQSLPGSSVEIYPGPLVSIKDASAAETRFGYDAATGELSAMTDAAGATSRFEVDARGYKLAEVDALGHRTTYVNDDLGRVIEERRTRTTAAGTQETLTTRYTYDTAGRLTATEHPDGSVTRTEYNDAGQVTAEVDALGRRTAHSYNDRGEETETRYADGSTESKTYDANGNVLTQTDRGGRTTTFVHDAANRLVETVHPDADTADADDSNNPRTRSVYDAAGQLVESVDENGQATKYEYDAAGRRIKTLLTAVDGAAATITDAYDDSGRRTSSTDAEGHVTTYRYDAGGRLIETEQDGAIISVEYDAVGRKQSDTDAMGRVTRYGYDALGRLTTVVLPNPQTGANPPLLNGQSPDTGTLTTRYVYDALGNKTQQIDAEGRITRWEYDRMGRETARILPAGQRETKQYNVAGELIAHTDFEGKTTRYRYDNLGRAETIDYPNDPDVGFGYNAPGERTEVTDGRGRSRMSFDRRSRVVLAHDADGGRIEYSYDAAGNLLSRTSLSQSLVYTYDARHRMTAVTRTVDGEALMTTRYEYDQDGNRTAMLGGDGLRTEYSYDRKHRLTSLIKRTAAGAMLLAMQYTVDASGMRSAVTEQDALGTSRTVAWSYDATKRLTREAIDHRDADKDRTSVWTYDDVGNRLTQSVAIGASANESTSYVYDANDRLLSETKSGGSQAGATTYTYDDNGNTRSKTGPGGATTYRYDDANRLIEAVTPEGTSSYVYTADGLRVRQTHTPQGGTATTTWYVQDTAYPYAQVIEEYTSHGSGAKQLAATFTFADELVSQTRYVSGSPTTQFIQFDGFGSTRWLTNGAGTITDTIDYDAFGNEVGRTGTTAIEHLYRGEAFDPNVGFYYLRARWMDPSSGRFTQQDSFSGLAGQPQTLHKYAYAHANPVLFSDPSGNLVIIGLDLGGTFTSMGARAAAANVSRVTANRIAGKALEKFVESQLQRFVSQYGGQIFRQVYFRGPGGVRFADFVLKVGNRFVAIEVKTNFPLAGHALVRLAGQIRTFVLGSSPNPALAGSAAEVIVITEESVAVLEASFLAVESQVATGTLAGVMKGTSDLMIALRAILMGI